MGLRASFRLDMRINHFTDLIVAELIARPRAAHFSYEQLRPRQAFNKFRTFAFSRALQQLGLKRVPQNRVCKPCQRKPSALSLQLAELYRLHTKATLAAHVLFTAPFAEVTVQEIECGQTVMAR